MSRRTNAKPPVAPPAPLLSLKQAAERLRLSVRTLRRMMDAGELAVLRVGRGRGALRVTEAEIDRLLARAAELGYYY